MKTVTNVSAFQKLPVEERVLQYIPEAVTTTHPINDTGEQLMRLTPESSLPGILLATPNNDKVFLREGCLKGLQAVGASIWSDMKGEVVLKVTDAFRPLVIQRKLFREIEAEIAKRERLTGKQLWERVTQFIADPSLCPPHSTGGAVDCTLVQVETGQELDMGTTVDALSDDSYTWSKDISEEAIRNRTILFEHMTAQGFVNLATEWWHYSFGDQYWALFSNKPSALYGSMEDYPNEK